MNRNKGFINGLVIILLALAGLKYFFDWSIFDALNSPQGEKTLDYMKDVVSVAWEMSRETLALVWDKMLALVGSR